MQACSVAWNQAGGRRPGDHASALLRTAAGRGGPAAARRKGAVVAAEQGSILRSWTRGSPDDLGAYEGRRRLI